MQRSQQSTKVAAFVTHPIQYFSPIWQQLSATPGIDLFVHYFSDHSVTGGVDAGFGRQIAWDRPLLAGHNHRFLSRNADLSKKHLVRIRQPRRLLVEAGFDVVLCHGYLHAFERQAIRTANRLRLRTVLRGEFTDKVRPRGRTRVKSLLRDAYLSWFYSHVDAFCYFGEDGREHLTAHGVSPKRQFFSPYSIDSTHFEAMAASSSRADSRKTLGIANDDVVFLFSGKMIPRKAPLLLVEALRHVENVANVSVIFVGSGELHDRVAAEARTILGAKAILPGFVNQCELGGYFSAADVLVLPSMYETWGLVANEAMHFGLPVVASTGVQSAKCLVVEGVTGFSFPTGDAHALARCMNNFIAQKSLATRMGVAAKDRISAYTTEKSVAGILDAIWNQ